MPRLRPCLYAFLLFFLFLLPDTHAQICTPDPAYTNPGIYPASLPSGCVGDFYSLIITAVVPVDTPIDLGFPFGIINVPIDSINLIAINGLPPGLSVQCTSPACGVPGGTAGCYVVSGIPTASGTFSIDIIAEGHVTIFGSPLSIPDTTLNANSILIHAPPVGSLNGTSSLSLSCAGDNDGFIAVDLSGGAPPFTFAWSNGASTQNISGLAAGAYSLTVTDTNNCTGTFSETVIEPPALTLALTAVNASFPGVGDGSASATFGGGTGMHYFLWSNGATTASISALDTGTYVLTLSDDNGCSLTDSVTVGANMTLITGSTCTLSDDLGAIPAARGGLSTALSGNFYSVGQGCPANYLSGNDYVLSYTPATTECIGIILGGTAPFTGLYVFDGCPDQPLTSCVAMDTSETALSPALDGILLNAGTTYYIVVSSLSSMTPSTSFDIEVDISVNCVVLQIPLLTIRGWEEKGSVWLEWAFPDLKAVPEVSWVERWDGIDFQTLPGTKDQIDAQGNAVVYRFRDKDPMPGENAYRLRFADAEGRYFYSEVVRVMANPQHWVRVFPNPTNGKCTISLSFPPGTSVEVQVLDGMGKLCRKAFLEHDGGELDLSGFSRGLYFISISSEQNQFWEKLILTD